MNVNNPDMIEFYHDHGWMPDKFYYQLNGKSAQENFNDWHNKMMAKLLADDSDDDFEIHITSEVKKK